MNDSPNIIERMRPDIVEAGYQGFILEAQRAARTKKPVSASDGAREVMDRVVVRLADLLPNEIYASHEAELPIWVRDSAAQPSLAPFERELEHLEEYNCLAAERRRLAIEWHRNLLSNILDRRYPSATMEEL